MQKWLLYQHYNLEQLRFEHSPFDCSQRHRIHLDHQREHRVELVDLEHRFDKHPNHIRQQGNRKQHDDGDDLENFSHNQLRNFDLELPKYNPTKNFMYRVVFWVKGWS